jgi:hypothetical protein
MSTSHKSYKQEKVVKSTLLEHFKKKTNPNQPKMINGENTYKIFFYQIE